MARRVKDADREQSAAGAAAGHNSKARSEIIAECAMQMRRINEERKTLNEDAGGIRERLKDAGIDVKSFMAALRLSDMENAAARNTYMDGLREACAALGIGGQLDWVEVAQAQEAAAAGEEDVRPEFLKQQERERAEAQQA